MGLNRINKPEPLAKTALKALRHSILANDLTTGVVYNEKQLAQDLGISRTPVREALLELSSKRLVRFLPQKGVIINTFSQKDIEDVFDVRTALEVYSITKVCRNIKTTNISVLKECLAEQKKSAGTGDTNRFMEADRRFHISFTTLTNNNYLMDMMHDIRDMMHLMGFKALGLEGRMHQVIREHEAVLKAVCTGDAATAVAQMETHLALSKAAVNKTKEEKNNNG
ncbi:MAG: GntR family transcriptional regulator [Desulfobacterales bacterium]|nr:GntR family transcriptional regulator [Desulfobacterales bacterium]